jgi:hypothetical protein
MYVQPPTWTMCKNVEIFNDFVEFFFKSWQFPFQKSLNLQHKKKNLQIFGRVKICTKKNGWSPLLSDYIIGSSTSCLIIIFFTLSTSMARSTTSSFAFFSEIACWNKAKKTVGNYTPSIAFILYSYYFRAKRMHAMYNLPTKRWVFNHWSHFIKTMFHLATFVLVSYVWSISSIFLMIMC